MYCSNKMKWNGMECSDKSPPTTAATATADAAAVVAFHSVG